MSDLRGNNTIENINKKLYYHNCNKFYKEDYKGTKSLKIPVNPKIIKINQIKKEVINHDKEYKDVYFKL